MERFEQPEILSMVFRFFSFIPGNRRRSLAQFPTRKARVLGCLNDVNQLATMLRAEAALKPGARHPFGFSHGS